MIKCMDPFQRILSSVAIVSLAILVCIGFFWIQNQLAMHELQTRLKTAEMALSQSDEPISEPSFPVEPLGLRLLDLAVRSARDAGLEVTSVRSSPVALEQIGSNTYQATHVSIRVTGNINQIIAFLDLMEVGAISSMAVDEIELKWADDRWEVSLGALAYTVPG